MQPPQLLWCSSRYCCPWATVAPRCCTEPRLAEGWLRREVQGSFWRAFSSQELLQFLYDRCFQVME